MTILKTPPTLTPNQIISVISPLPGYHKRLAEMKMISIQKIDVPSDCEIITNDFYNYDPKKAFKEADNYRYLSEDLFQCTFPEESLIIDLGWYGDLKTNTGEFKIDIIFKENWEIPMHTIYSGSVLEIKELLIKILDYYSGIIEEEKEEE